MMLSPTVSARLDFLAADGNVLSESGKHAAAIQKWEQALALLPEPKTDWEASTWLYASIGDAYYAQRKFEDARVAFFDALNCPDAVANPFIQYRLGQCHIRLGHEERGVDHLLRAYMLDGENIFSSDNEGAEFMTVLRRRQLI